MANNYICFTIKKRLPAGFINNFIFNRKIAMYSIVKEDSAIMVLEKKGSEGLVNKLTEEIRKVGASLVEKQTFYDMTSVREYLQKTYPEIYKKGGNT